MQVQSSFCTKIGSPSGNIRFWPRLNQLAPITPITLIAQIAPITPITLIAPIDPITPIAPITPITPIDPIAFDFCGNFSSLRISRHGSEAVRRAIEKKTDTLSTAK